MILSAAGLMIEKSEQWYTYRYVAQKLQVYKHGNDAFETRDCYHKNYSREHQLRLVSCQYNANFVHFAPFMLTDCTLMVVVVLCAFDAQEWYKKTSKQHAQACAHRHLQII